MEVTDSKQGLLYYLQCATLASIFTVVFLVNYLSTAIYSSELFNSIIYTLYSVHCATFLPVKLDPGYGFL